MEIKDILRTNPGRHVGYMPTVVSKTTFDPKGICDKLRRIPGKISAYFHRSMISEVFKSDHQRDNRDNYYIIRATDGTLFHIDY